MKLCNTTTTKHFRILGIINNNLDYIKLCNSFKCHYLFLLSAFGITVHKQYNSILKLNKNKNFYTT